MATPVRARLAAQNALVHPPRGVPPQRVGPARHQRQGAREDRRGRPDLGYRGGGAQSVSRWPFSISPHGGGFVHTHSAGASGSSSGGDGRVDRPIGATHLGSTARIDRRDSHTRQELLAVRMALQTCQPAHFARRTFSTTDDQPASRPGQGREERAGRSRVGRPRVVLALESSADDSCCAIVDDERKVWSNVVIKQHEMNATYGGIHPLVAGQLHAANVPRAIAMALKQAGMGIDEMDAIAYTRGPGMHGCLNVCAGAAKALAAAHDIPLLGIHHMQAHALTPLLTEPEPPSYPFLVVLVSGGHTQLVLAKSMDEFTILANCSDTKIGDAFDKVARLLRLPHSPDRGSGAVLESYASMDPLPPFDTKPGPKFPIPMSTGQHAHQLQFSFSGLLSSVERYILKLQPTTSATQVGQSTAGSPARSAKTPDPPGNRIQRENAIELSEGARRAISRSFQSAAITHLTQKIALALSLPELQDVQGVVVSGGVASNQALRTELQRVLDKAAKRRIKLYYPPVALCTDNAAMIAWTALLRLRAGEQGEGYDLPLRPKWSIEEVHEDA